MATLRPKAAIEGFPRVIWRTTAPDPSVARLREAILNEPLRADVERALLTTEAYRDSEGQPTPFRRAAMMMALCDRTTISILDGELIVGNRSARPRMGVIAPESAVAWIDRELETLGSRPQDRFEISEPEIALLRERVFPYWRGRTLEDAVASAIPKTVREGIEAGVVKLNQTDHAQGHILPDVESWLRLGIDGLWHRSYQAEQAAPEGSPERVFYGSVETTLRGVEWFVRRHALALEAQASACADPLRRGQLLEMARNCRRVAMSPPMTFWEALQSLWFLFVLLQMESNASSFSPGRLDQVLMPYLRADLQAGRLSLEWAQLLLDHLWLKFNQIVLLRSAKSARYFAGFPIGFNVTIGGQLADGRDATNLLTYMCLRAQADVGLTQPNLSLRVHEGSPTELLEAASAVIGRGSGMPQVFGDAVIIDGLQQRGIDEQDARNYAAVGCVELSVPGIALGWSDAAMFNMARLLELTLYGGRDPRTGRQYGPETPPLSGLDDYAALEAAYDTQMRHYVGLMLEGCGLVDRLHAEMLPSPLLSAVIGDCMETGRDVTAGGARYNLSGLQGVQIANVADSLWAVRKAVYEQGWLSAEALLGALDADFEGQEAVRQRLLAETKYGNDQDGVDLVARQWAQRYAELLYGAVNARGGPYHAGFYTVSAHVPMGSGVGATPDGRKAGQPLADGGLSPTAGLDRNGPTAVLRSLQKLGLECASNGALLNLKFLPDLFADEAGLTRFAQLLQAFARMRIPHVQFNVVSQEALRDAQQHPERYRRLVVRVAGYSAYFTELARDLQDEIIRRTSHESV